MPARRSLWDILIRRNPHADMATELYGRLVTAAREPAFYATLGAPDTPEGRFEVLVVHVVLLVRRLTRDGEAMAGLARALSETFITDMDDCLREMGVSDISVAKKVNKAAAALFDRLRDYGGALENGDRDALAGQLASHVLVTSGVGPEALRLAAYVIASEQLLSRTQLDEVTAGAIAFPKLTD